MIWSNLTLLELKLWVSGVSVDFILGEEKRLGFEVKSKSGQTLVITEAKFQLISNGTVLQGGNCDIDGQKLYCLIKPTERGYMYLEMEYVIAPETRKARININVV